MIELRSERMMRLEVKQADTIIEDEEVHATVGLQHPWRHHILYIEGFIVKRICW